jgi:rubrerythrin
MPALLDTVHSADRHLIAVQALLAERRYPRQRPRPQADPSRSGDPAMYRCDCGHVFSAPVSTHVACPICGHDQPW